MKWANFFDVKEPSIMSTARIPSSDNPGRMEYLKKIIDANSI
jgi:hypothetical protein